LTPLLDSSDTKKRPKKTHNVQNWFGGERFGHYGLVSIKKKKRKIIQIL